MEDVKFVEVDGNKFVDDGTGSPKLDNDGNPIPYVGEGEKPVPYHRFKEVNEKVAELTEQINSLKSQREKGELSEEQTKELKAKEYLKTLLKETLSENEKEATEREAQELKSFEKSVDEALGANPDVARAKFIEFLEKEGDDYSTVEAAMRGFKRQSEISKDAAEKAKDDLRRKPGSLKHEGGTGEKPPEEDKGRTLRQIAEDAIRSLGKK